MDSDSEIQIQATPRVLRKLERRGLTREDVDSIAQGPRYMHRAKGGRYMAVGRGVGGRFVTLILSRLGGPFHRLHTGWPSTAWEKRLYKRHER